jgi:hypothetical protein
VTAFSQKDIERHIDEQLCYKCHKPGHRMCKCPEIGGETSDIQVRQGGQATPMLANMPG